MPFDGTGYEGRIEALDKMDKVIDLLARPPVRPPAQGKGHR